MTTQPGWCGACRSRSNPQWADAKLVTRCSTRSTSMNDCDFTTIYDATKFSLLNDNIYFLYVVFNKCRLFCFFCRISRCSMTDSEASLHWAVQCSERLCRRYAKRGFRADDTSVGLRGFTTTVVCRVNAAARNVPPMMIYRRRRLNPNSHFGAPPGTVIERSDNGWMTKELFLVWIKNFHNHVKSSPANPGLLILDGHYSHTRNMAAIDWEDGIAHYEKLENILTELDSFIQPRRIYDLDEKGCRQTLHHQQSVIAVKPTFSCQWARWKCYHCCLCRRCMSHYPSNDPERFLMVSCMYIFYHCKAYSSFWRQ